MARISPSFSSELKELDRAFIWHPYTQMKTAPLSIPITKGKGSLLYAADGTQYLDAISSWWVTIHGHTHPYIIEKIKAQLDKLEQVIFADFTHPPAIELAARLIQILPGKMSKIFYSDNGSTAVEVALKMALQYWHNLRISRKKIVCFKKSFHGETFGTMSASGKNELNRPFWSHLFEVIAIDPPLKGQEESSLHQLQNVLDQNEVACFIFEPLILGSGGMIIYPPHGLDSLLKLCKKNQVITIADEVMTGFGRTGPLFACALLDESPDIICVSKGLTGGFLPLAATACKERIFNAFLTDKMEHALLHGHSYTANPLACSSALANLDLLHKKTCDDQREKIASCHRQFCYTWKEHPKLKRCESLGTILALEYQTEHPSYFHSIRERLYRFFLSHQILLRPLGNVLYILPPYCICEEELSFIYEKIVQTFEH